MICFYPVGSCGLLFLFSAYSAAIKREFGFTQSQLTLINTTTYVAGLVQTLPGAFVDRVGPRTGLKVAGCGFFAAFGCEWLIMTRRLAMPEGAVLPALCCVAFFSCLCNSCVTPSAFPVLYSMFEPSENRDFVFGIAKCWIGLFGALILNVYSCLFGELDDSSKAFRFVAFLAVASFALLIPPSLLITKRIAKPSPPQAYKVRLRFMVRLSRRSFPFLIASTYSVCLSPPPPPSLCLFRNQLYSC
jgi:nitrate/nitrite transporter NarK